MTKTKNRELSALVAKTEYEIKATQNFAYNCRNASSYAPDPETVAKLCDEHVFLLRKNLWNEKREHEQNVKYERLRADKRYLTFLLVANWVAVAIYFAWPYLAALVTF